MEKDNLENFLDKAIEEIFAERFGRYSKYIIQERALPDVRDGLKPVQRRILYAMFKDNNVFDKQFRKSAKTVGNVIGNYHPHGDSSVYDAMVRMSQSWKTNEQLVIMHGNNGSIDGDNPAAMRYTEAKLSKYAEYLLSNIDKNTVNMIPNFDDTELEPTVLPCRVPNLLVNGTSGIASGYATDIPPHNIGEVLKATIYLNKNREATLKQLMKYIKAPDFPTGGIIKGIEGVEKAYQTGRGKLVLQAKYNIIKNDIIISEIPYDVNKATLLQKIEILKIDGKIDGIAEIIDQSGQEGLEIKITCTSGSNPQLIMNFLLKNTDLQKNYNFNMIAINKLKPEQLGLKDILQSFLDHREDVITRRSNYLLDKANKKHHIVMGIIIAISNLDKVVKIIRASQDKIDAKKNLIKEFQLSENQAEAIVMMQLYRLTNTDIQSLQESKIKLEEEIAKLTNILNDYQVLIQTIEDELEEILKEIKCPRKTKVEKEFEEIVINKEDLIKEENNIVVLTEHKYIKRSSLRSYATAKNNPQIIEGDKIQHIIQASTKEKLIIFYNNGQYALIPVYDIIENKWKEIGKSIGTLIKDGEQDKIIGIEKFNPNNDSYYVGVTKLGYIVKINSLKFDSKKTKSKIKFQGLKENDEVVSVNKVEKNQDVIMINNNDKFIITNENEIKEYDIKRVGIKVKGLNQKETMKYVNKIEENILVVSEDCYGYLKKEKIKKENFRFEPLFLNYKGNNQTIAKIIVDIKDNLLIIKDNNYEEVSKEQLTLINKDNKIKKSNLINNVDLIMEQIKIK